MAKTSYEVTKRYHDKAMKKYTMMFHRVSDSDVISAIDSSSNKTDFIRQAVRARIKKESTEST